MQDSMRKLWSFNDRYILDYTLGANIGRRLNVWDLMRNYFEQFKSIGTNLFS